MSSLDWVLARVAGSANWGTGEVDYRPLAERMGYTSLDKLLILNCDDLGSSQSANIAIEKALRNGIATSATLMVPCPWAEVAASVCKDLDIGIHLTLTSEYRTYRWPSLTGARSLHDKEGYLWATVREVWANADLSDVERECRAQINRAREWGIEPTHLDSHMHVLQHNRRFFEVYIRLATEYVLPVRLLAPSVTRPFTYLSRSTAKSRAVVTPDRFLEPPWGQPLRDALLDAIDTFPPGVTEIVAHPAVESLELRARDADYAGVRIDDAQLLMNAATGETLARHRIRLVGYRALRDVMREAGRSSANGPSARNGKSTLELQRQASDPLPEPRASRPAPRAQ